MCKSKVFHTNRTNGFFIDHIKRGNPYHMHSKHYHSQYEIYYLLHGDRNYFIQDRVYNVQKGDLVLIKSNVLHKTVDGYLDSHERILIEFDNNFFEDFLVNYNVLQCFNAFHKDCNILRLEDPDKIQVENCLFKILQESKENNLDSIALKVYFLELLIIINKFDSKSKAMEFDHLSIMHKRISEIISYMNLNYANDIGLDLIAEEFLISTAHLSRTFKNVTGFSFVEYLNNLRIHEAGKLLTDSTLRISDIASMVGYQSSTHFGRMFKSITGNSPREYRNKRL